MDRRSVLLATPAVLAGGCGSAGGAAGPPAPAPTVRVGDRWVYNCSDGYRVQVTWVETHEVIIIDATGIAVRVTLVGPTMNYERIELWVSPGVVAIGSAYDDAENRTFKAHLQRDRKVRETKYATYRERGDMNAISVRAQNTVIAFFFTVPVTEANSKR